MTTPPLSPSLAEKLDKIKSPGLQSQAKTVVVLNSIESKHKEQNIELTPSVYFSALLGLLKKTGGGDEGSPNTDLAVPIVYLLDVVTPFVPQPLLQASFVQIFSTLAPILLLEDAEPILLRSSIGCLESLLIAQNASSWELSVSQISPRRAVSGLLNLSLDGRPKVRRRAQDAIKKVLRNPPPSPLLDHPAADMSAETAAKNLEELAEKSAEARKGNKSDTSKDPAVIHALQLVKTVAVASGGWPSKNLESFCELLLGIAKTGNEYMTMAVFEIFEVIFGGMTGEVSSAKLPRLMEIISELRPAANDTRLVPPWLAILSRGYDVSAQVEPDEVFQNLPDLFTMVAQFMDSHAENIRISAAECLVSLMANCIPPNVILEPSVYDEKILGKLAKSAESLLSVQYQAAWLQTFTVIGAMFDSLRWRADPVLLNVTKIIGEIRQRSSFRNKKEADEVIGKAVRAMGPESVLSVLPLCISKPVKGQSGKAWMMPILRDYTSNTDLAHFKSEMVPLSEFLFQKVLDHGEAEKTMEIKIYETLVQQVWSILPGYCDLPLDLTSAFDQSFGEMLANILYKQVEVRLDICRALRTLIESNQAIAGIPDEEPEDLILQSRITRQVARDNLKYLGGFAGNMLAVLFNVYTNTLPRSRGPMLQTINAFLSITPNQEVINTFDRVTKIVAEELQNSADAPKQESKEKKQGKSDDHMPSTAQTLMDLVITMSVYLPRESFGALFEIAAVVINRHDEPQLQKKAYKLIPRLAESETGKVALEQRITELQSLIVASTDNVSLPARRDRLAAMIALLPYIPNDSLHFIPTVLSEVIVTCKENNERARETAYELLVQMGHRMDSAEGATIDNTKVPHMAADAPAGKASLEEYFIMVSAGLAGDTPHLISASITAVSRLLYEFRSSLSEQTLTELVQTMDVFLTIKNREIVKSCLGFAKVCATGLPVELMMPRLSTLVPNLMRWGHEHKGHFKSKVKHIIERMVRRFGYDNIYKHCPEADRKLMNNIRKTKDRAKRKKEAAKGANDDAGSDDEPKNRQFENEYDQALYSSDSDDSESDSDGSDDGEGPAANGAGKKAKKGGKTYIIEDDDEPLDLLGKQALANVSSTRPVKMRKPTKTKAKVDIDGKLVLGDDTNGGDAMDVDGGAANPETSGVGAYVAAINGKDAAKRGRGGRLKFSNRRSKDDMDDDDDDGREMNTADATAVKSSISPRGRGGGKFRGRGGGGARSGRGGIAAGRRGLGVDKRHGQGAGGVGKGNKRR